jgi:hypothetical protein
MTRIHIQTVPVYIGYAATSPQCPGQITAGHQTPRAAAEAFAAMTLGPDAHVQLITPGNYVATPEKPVQIQEAA